MKNQNTKIYEVPRKQHSIWDSYSIRVTEIALGGDGRNSTGSQRKGREWKEESLANSSVVELGELQVLAEARERRASPTTI